MKDYESKAAAQELEMMDLQAQNEQLKKVENGGHGSYPSHFIEGSRFFQTQAQPISSYQQQDVAVGKGPEKASNYALDEPKQTAQESTSTSSRNKYRKPRN